MSSCLHQPRTYRACFSVQLAGLHPQKTTRHQQHLSKTMISIVKEPTRCMRCQGTLFKSVIIAAELLPRHHKKPRERHSTRLLHVCEQCATEGEMNWAKTQVTCPGCSRTLLVPHQ